MPATAFTRTYDRLASHIVDKLWGGGVFEDAIFGAYAFWAWAKENGLIETVSSPGEFIRCNLIFEKGNVGAYPQYGELIPRPTKGFTAAFFDWCSYWGDITITGMEQWKNQGPEQIANLVTTLVTQQTMTFAETMNTDLLDATVLADGEAVTGAGAPKLASLHTFMQEDPTVAKTVGKIAQGANAWWRNQIKDLSGMNTGKLFHKALGNMINTVGKFPGGRPQALLVTQTIFEDYEAWLGDRVRYMSEDKATPGFNGIAFKGNVELLWDDMASAGDVLSLNTNLIKVFQAAGKNFTPSPFEKQQRQDVSVADLFWYGALGCKNRRLLIKGYNQPGFTT